MIYLFLSIISTTLLVVIFKLFEKWNINVSQAIVFNYLTAAIIGFVLDGMQIPVGEIIEKPWFAFVFIFGFMFFTLFNILGISTQKVGITFATVAFKMCMVIPVIAAVFLYNDRMPVVKITGIILACLAVWLSSVKKEDKQIEKKYLILPVILFFGSGFLDTLFKYTEKYYLAENEINIFSSLSFFTAAGCGVIFLIISIILGKSKFQIKSVPAGILLGIPNYGSLYFLFKALRIQGIESSVVFPLNNMGIVALSALVAIFIFREKPSLINWAGIVLAIVSIAMIAWA